MMGFRVLLVLMLLVLTGYTGVVIANHGWNLIPLFFGDIAAMTWPGQFNTDFMGFLILSGLWTAWRHHFAPLGLLLGLIAVFGGMMFLTIYLLVVSAAAKGELATSLPGGIKSVASLRLDTLGDEARDVLRTASVVGREIDLGVLRAVSARPAVWPRRRSPPGSWTGRSRSDRRCASSCGRR